MEKKHFVKIVTNLVTVLHYVYVFILYLQKSIILSLFKIDTLKFTTNILTILTCPLKTYVIRLPNLISMNIFITIK